MRVPVPGDITPFASGRFCALCGRDEFALRWTCWTWSGCGAEMSDRYVVRQDRGAGEAAHSARLSSVLSSCDELPRPTDSSSRCPRLSCPSPAPRSRTPGRPRNETFDKQTEEDAASRVARRPALERSHLGICVRGRPPVYSEGDQSRTG